MMKLVLEEAKRRGDRSAIIAIIIALGAIAVSLALIAKKAKRKT